MAAIQTPKEWQEAAEGVAARIAAIMEAEKDNAAGSVGLVNVVHMLLDRGAGRQIHASPEGDLARAVLRAGQPETDRRLSLGTDPAEPNSGTGLCAQDWAVLLQLEEIVNLLIRHRATLNQLRGFLTLHGAVSRRDWSAAEWLLANGPP